MKIQFKNIKLSIFFIVACLLFSQHSVADNLVLINQDLDKIVKSFDDKAVVLFEGTEFQDKLKLPGTPYSLSQSRLGTLKFESVKIKIISNVEIPKYVKSLISNRLKKISKNIKYSIFQPEIIKKPDVVKKELLEDKQVSNELPAVINPVEKSIFTVNSLHDLFKWAGIVAAGFMMLCISYLLFFKKSPLTDIQSSIESCSSQIVGALENKESFEESINENLVSNSEDLGNLSKQLKEIPYSGIKELLFDSYWSEEDNYASFVWKHIDRKLLTKLIDEESALYEYGKYLNSIKSQPFNFHLDPYYLKPLELHHIDNRSLKILVEEELSWAINLPLMRLNNLKLSVSQKINISKFENVKEGKKFFSMAKGMKSTKLRKFNSEFEIKIDSVSEEIELLQFKDLKVKDKKRTFTWVWGLDIEKEGLSKILSNYSAQELAQAWVGPKEVLKHFGECMPEKKSSLVQSYLEKSNPKRSSWVYKEICRKIINELKTEPIKTHEQKIFKVA